MNIMGIDPGYTGGIAIINSVGKVEFYRKMPIRISMSAKGDESKLVDAAQVAAMIAKFEPSHVFIEKAQAMPRNGAVGMFNYGVGYGMILGLCVALEQVFETHPIPPIKWHKFMCDPGDAPTKQRALAAFHRLWPDLVEQNVTHEGIVDAMLIAEYGRRSLGLH